MGKKFLKTYEILLRKAITDLRVAKNILEDFKNGETELDLEVVYFHLQQSAEKLIKTILDFHKILFPKIHDINELIDLLKENDLPLFDNIENLIPLSDYAVEGRYSILLDDISDAQKYIDILDRFICYVQTTDKLEVN